MSVSASSISRTMESSISIQFDIYDWFLKQNDYMFIVIAIDGRMDAQTATHGLSQ